MRVVVVGAGAWGASVAAELARRGARVAVVDRAGPGSGTTARGAGIVRHAQAHPVNAQLVARSAEAFRALSRRGERDGHPFRYRETASWTLLPPAEAALARAFERVAPAVRALDASEARVPAAALDDVATVVHAPGDGWALPRLYAEVTLAGARARGVEVVRGEASLAQGGVRVGDRALPADAVVLAAGAWTREILRAGGLDAPLVAYRTQLARIAHDLGALPIVHDRPQGCYLRPHWPGQLLVGDGTTLREERPDAYATQGDAGFVESVLRRLERRFPKARLRALDAWAGVDAATPDALPLAGEHPERRGLWLLAGGNGHGFMRAPALGECVAALVLGEKPPVDVSAFAPARFAGRMSEPFAPREGSDLSGFK